MKNKKLKIQSNFPTKSGKYQFGISPCPNDIFIFYGMLNNKISSDGLVFDFLIEDVETLNDLCIKKFLPISKISAHAFAYLEKDYEILSAGSAISDFGPVVVAKNINKLKELSEIKIALPGRHTTASALMWFYWKRNFFGKIYHLNFMPFNQIIDKVLSGEVDIGVLIHEGRFTYENIGLELVADLGIWWKEETSLPVPLGCIIAKKSLNLKEKLEDIIKESLNYAYSNYSEVLNFAKKYAQELDLNVIKSHIDFYVNKMSFDMGERGYNAINTLVKMIHREGVWSLMNL